MHLGRLAVLCTVFIGASLSAEAQYTSKTTTSGFTTKTTAATTSPAPVKPTNTNTTAARSNPYTGNRAAPAQAKTNSFTTNSGTKTTPAAQANAAPTQAVFRPRPQAAPVSEADDDELPSFDVLEGTGGSNQGAQGSNLPPPPPPKGEIWLYITDFDYRDTTGMTMNCGWKAVIQNRTDTPISQLKLFYKLIDINFAINLKNLAAGSSVVEEHAAYNSKCPAMGQAKPKPKISKCKMGPLADQECASYIIVK